VHAVYGGLYGKPHAVIEGHKRTGDLMPVLAQLGPAVPAGLTRYASRVFGTDYQDTFFAAMFNLRKVSRFVLEPRGATFEAHESDFVVSTDRDFHPTDVLEDADGSLIVVDTGPWYKLCCPTSQLAKPDVLGAIYRVRRQGAPTVRDPRGLTLGWDAMTAANAAKLLDDPRPAVQGRVVQRFSQLGSGAVEALSDVLKTSRSVAARRNAVWALTRIDGPAAREAVRVGLNDRDASVIQAALHSAGLLKDRGARQQIAAALQSSDAAVQRTAAEALGRLGDAASVPALVAAAATPSDRALEHSLTYALIEIDDSAATVASGLKAPSVRARRAALIALDQMDHGELKQDGVISLLDARDPILKETGWWIASHHPEWGDALAHYFQQRLTVTTLSAAEREDLQQKIAQFGDNAAIQALLASRVGQSASPADRAAALRTMAAATKTRGKDVPAGWIDPVVRALADGDVEVVRQGIAVVRAGVPPKEPVRDLDAALMRVARDSARPADVRLDALAAMQNAAATVDTPLFELLRAGLDAGQPVSVRTSAARVLEKATLDRTQLLALTQSLRTAGPLELPRVLHAFDNGHDEALGLAMVGAIEQSNARASVRADVLRPRLAQYPAAVQQAGEVLLASLNVDTAKQVKRLEELLATSADGDIRRGQAVFNGQKAACATCHAIGYIGGRIGPDLTRIGQVRSERDLLEAIVFPNASFARGYEPVVVRTTGGEVHGGVLRSDQPDEVVLAIGERDEKRIPRQAIADMQPGTVSLMPPGFGDQLTRQELADLLAFLKAAR
jgi:putative heme-binding domain-containing protein